MRISSLNRPPFIFVAILIVLALMAVGMFTGWPPISHANSKEMDLSSPDALIRSQKLSRLPADLLKVPLLHDLLTEDFLFYYEHNESRISLNGTLRRIAYEHDQNMLDGVVKLVFDEPADVALWRGSKGELKHYVIAMTRNNVAKLIEPLAKIALNDRQLSKTGDIDIDGKQVALYRLNYGYNKSILFASFANRLAILSDTTMAINADGNITRQTASALANLLSEDKLKQQKYAQLFELSEATARHSIVVKADFLSFHYQKFFPAIQSLRFDFGDKPSATGNGWATYLLLHPQANLIDTKSENKSLWQSLPHQAGACLSLPVDWNGIARSINGQKAAGIPAEQLASAFNGPAAVCWYPQSRLHTPLFAAQLSNTSLKEGVLEGYFNYAIRQPALKQGDENAPPPPAKTPITMQKNRQGDLIWQLPNKTGQMQPTLARSGKLVFFSPDSRLVERALEVTHKRQPAISDRWKSDTALNNTMGMLGPDALSQLAELELDKSLPRQQEELLRAAADKHLIPRLAAIRKYPPLRLELKLPADKSGWVALDWNNF